MATVEKKKSGKPAQPVAGKGFAAAVAAAFRAWIAKTGEPVLATCKRLKWSTTTYYRIYNGESADAAGCRIDEICKAAKLPLAEFLALGGTPKS